MGQSIKSNVQGAIVQADANLYDAFIHSAYTKRMLQPIEIQDTQNMQK